MERRTSSGLTGPAAIIALLAALGLGPALRTASVSSKAPSLTAGGGGPSSSYSSRKSGNAGYEEGGGYEHGAGYLLEKFFGRLSDSGEKGKAWASNPDRDLPPKDAFQNDLRRRYSAECLIVTLPTPISPPLRYLFDSAREALEAAVVSEGYSLDSFDLPWTSGSKDASGKFQLDGEIDVVSPDEAPEPSPTATPIGKETKTAPKPKYLYALRTNTENDNRWRRDCGVILFRNDQKHHILIVFVVGEAPTYGVNRLEFRDALDQIAWLQGWSADADDRKPAQHLADMFQPASKVIRVVGPIFSGSAPSMRNVLEEWRHYRAPNLDPKLSGLAVKIISGTATAVDPNDLAVSAGSDGKLAGITYNLVQVPDSVLWEGIPYVLNDISNMGEHLLLHPASTDRPPPVAVLEEATPYGRSAGSIKSDPKRWVKRRISFPLHISQLRSVVKGDQGDGGQKLGLQRKDLDLPDESGQLSVGVIMPYSPRAVMYDELVLNNLLETIRREGIRYVGIVASDVEDLVFLIEQIRAACPDTVVFTTSADIRFLHSEANSALRGTLTFTTYSLFEDMQRWTSPLKGQFSQTFTGDSAYGVYNAVLAQLGASDEMLDYGEPFPTQLSYRYPTVQIGVVGRDDIWPVAYWVPSSNDSSVLGSPPAAMLPQPYTSSHYPPLFQVLLFILSLGFTVCVVTFMVGVYYPPRHRPWWLAVVGTKPQAGLRHARHISTLCFSSGMLVAEMIGLNFLMLPILRAQPGFEVWRGGGFWLIAIFELLVGGLTLVVWLVAMYQMVAGFWEEIRRPTRATIYPLLYLVFAPMPVWLTFRYVAQLWKVPPAFALFAFIRATDLHDAVSPLVALMFLGVAGFALAACHFWRAAMLEDRPLRVLVPALFSEPPSFRNVFKLQGKVVDLLEDSPGRWLATTFLIVLLGAAFTYFGLTKIRWATSIDGIRFDVMFITIGFGIYVMFSLALLRFVLTWQALRHLLQRLYSHPSRYSYTNLQLIAQPSHLSQQNIRLYEARPGLTGVEYCLGCVRSILRIARSRKMKLPVGNLAGYVNLRRQELEEVLREAEDQLEQTRNATQWAVTVAARQALYDKLARLTDIVAWLFEPVWRSSAPIPLRVTLATGDDKKTTDAMLLQQAELFMAARTVDFVRHVFPHLINLVGFAVPAVLAMVLAISVYPFPAHDTLLWVSWVVMLATIGLILYVFVGINRNAIISMMTGTEPGQFNWDSAFTLHLLLFAVIPILTLLGAQYPEALSGGLSWVGSAFGSGSGN